MLHLSSVLVTFEVVDDVLVLLLMQLFFCGSALLIYYAASMSEINPENSVLYALNS